jgi:hypothetical protein
MRISRAVAAGWLYARVVKTVINGRSTYRAQFVTNGRPPVRHPLGQEQVSLDLGSSVVDVVHGSGAFTVALADGLEDKAAQHRRQQRRLDRQHRAASPRCFDDKKRHIKGACHWKDRSKNARRAQVKLAELYRRTAEHRKTMHGALWNEILSTGTNIRADVDAQLCRMAENVPPQRWETSTRDVHGDRTP